MRFLRVAFLLVLVACGGDITGIIDGLRGATEFTPPARYREIWSSLEICSGLHQDFDAVKWYSSPALVVQDQRDEGVYLSALNIIVLRDFVLDPRITGQDLLIAHEEMHALLKGGADHPAHFFNGVCGWLLGLGLPVGPTLI